MNTIRELTEERNNIRGLIRYYEELADDTRYRGLCLGLSSRILAIEKERAELQAQHVRAPAELVRLNKRYEDLEVQIKRERNRETIARLLKVSKQVESLLSQVQEQTDVSEDEGSEDSLGTEST